jgi:hypothetical protein
MARTATEKVYSLQQHRMPPEGRHHLPGRYTPWPSSSVTENSIEQQVAIKESVAHELHEETHHLQSTPPSSSLPPSAPHCTVHRRSSSRQRQKRHRRKQGRRKVWHLQAEGRTDSAPGISGSREWNGRRQAKEFPEHK